MARANCVRLAGMVVDLPVIAYEEKTHKYVRGLGSLRVVRGTRDAEDGMKNRVCSNPVIHTQNPDFIKEMETWNVNDIVSIEGIIVTGNKNKVSYCPRCGSKNRYPGDFTYIEPIYIKTEKSYGKGEEAENCAKKDLNSRVAVSNRVIVAGNIGKNPKKLSLTNKFGKTIRFSQYGIVLNRTLFVAEDPADKTSDLVWVKSYGKNGDRDYFRLMKSSSVLIDGFLQTRGVRRHAVCPACGEQYDWKDDTMEIVPYSVEYLSGCRTEEEAIAEQERREEQSMRDILRDLDHNLSIEPKNDEMVDDEGYVDEKTEQ